MKKVVKKKHAQTIKSKISIRTKLTKWCQSRKYRSRNSSSRYFFLKFKTIQKFLSTSSPHNTQRYTNFFAYQTTEKEATKPYQTTSTNLAEKKFEKTEW